MYFRVERQPCPTTSPPSARRLSISWPARIDARP